VTSDGYPALRSLIGVTARKVRRRGRPTSTAPFQPAGRWTLLRSALTPVVEPSARTEPWCRLLLRRYGVMCRDLLANESAAPSWQELVRNYRRMEARGEVRGGRFVAGVAGEQYALSEVIPLLRGAGEDPEEKPIVLPATDPLNFSGRLDAGPRVPAMVGSWIVVEKGVVTEQEHAAEASAELASAACSCRLGT
jgi:ATP-dependent Lhr-like helicase